MKTFIALSIAIALTGCAATSSSTKSATAPAAGPYTGPVCLLTSPVAPDVKHSYVGEIEAGKQWYGGTDELLPLIADEARKLGSNAVISVKVGQTLGLWAWARPVGSGKAIKIEDFKAFNCQSSGGTLY